MRCPVCGTAACRHGKDRHGQQRYLCKHCRRTFIGADVPKQMNRLSTEQEAVILNLLAAGKSIREIARLTGHNKTTITLRRTQSDVPANPKSGFDLCDHCGKNLRIETKEFHRRTRRTKHKFCNQDCYAAFYKARRDADQCERCGVARKDIPIRHLTQGYCPKCYALMRSFGFDEAAVDAHQLTAVLDKELKSHVRHQ